MALIDDRIYLKIIDGLGGVPDRLSFDGQMLTFGGKLLDFGRVSPYVYYFANEDVHDEELPNNTAWFRFVIRHVRSERRTMGPNYRRNRKGLVLTQVFEPRNRGVARTREHVNVVTGLLEGAKLPESPVVYFGEASETEGAPEERWWQTTLTVPYEYEETVDGSR